MSKVNKEKLAAINERLGAGEWLWENEEGVDVFVFDAEIVNAVVAELLTEIAEMEK